MQSPAHGEHLGESPYSDFDSCSHRLCLYTVKGTYDTNLDRIIFRRSRLGSYRNTTQENSSSLEGRFGVQHQQHCSLVILGLLLLSV